MGTWRVPPKDTATVSASQVLNEEDVTDITFSGVDVFNDKTTMNFSFNRDTDCQPFVQVRWVQEDAYVFTSRAI